jgi:predicted nucleic acid-binding protein
MLAKVFLDTNILIYFYIGDDETKRSIVCNLLDNNDCFTSIQALNETSNVLFVKFKLDSIKIKKYLDNIESVCNNVLPVRRDTINTALEIKDRYGYSFFDCLMLSSALEGNCQVIFSEDMNDGQIINNSLKIVNPFK